MSDQISHALQDLERHGELEARTAYIIKILIQAELPCRAYDSPGYLENLADAVHNLWNHLCQLDTQNLAAWDIGVWELASLYGAANGARTFPREEKGEDKVLLALGDMIEHFERFVDREGIAVLGGDTDREVLNRAKEVYDEADYQSTNGAMDKLSDDMNPVGGDQ